MRDASRNASQWHGIAEQGRRRRKSRQRHGTVVGKEGRRFFYGESMPTAASEKVMADSWAGP